MSGKLLALADLMRNAGLDEGCITAADNDISLLYCDDPKEDAADDYCKLIETTQDVGLGHRELKVASGGTGKCIVFAQFTKSLDLVEDLILRPLMPRVRYLRLDGHVPSETRAELARRFNSDPSIRLFLSTTRVGGLGLNLTGKLDCTISHQVVSDHFSQRISDPLFQERIRFSFLKTTTTPSSTCKHKTGLLELSAYPHDISLLFLTPLILPSFVLLTY
jgi:hypothetical protein